MPRRQAALSLEFILLGFLHQQPAHGYDLYKKLSTLEGVTLVWNVKQPQMYALLDRLEADGLIAARLVPGDAHPDRREFSITSTGAARFEAWSSTPVTHFRDMRQEFMAKLYFTQQAEKTHTNQLLDLQIETCRGWITAIEAQIDALGAKEGFERMLFNYRLAQARTTLGWLTGLRSQIGGGA